jgi:hypothetical protein
MVELVNAPYYLILEQSKNSAAAKHRPTEPNNGASVKGEGKTVVEQI